MWIDLSGWFALPHLVPPVVGFLAARVLSFPRPCRAQSVARLRLCELRVRLTCAGQERVYQIAVDPEGGIGQGTIMVDRIVTPCCLTTDPNDLFQVRAAFLREIAGLMNDGWRRED